LWREGSMVRFPRAVRNRKPRARRRRGNIAAGQHLAALWAISGTICYRTDDRTLTLSCSTTHIERRGIIGFSSFAPALSRLRGRETGVLLSILSSSFFFFRRIISQSSGVGKAR
jgi:hypothetical protein